MSGPNRKDNKKKNIETYAKALQEIVNFDIKKIRNPAKYIRNRDQNKTFVDTSEKR